MNVGVTVHPTSALLQKQTSSKLYFPISCTPYLDTYEFARFHLSHSRMFAEWLRLQSFQPHRHPHLSIARLRHPSCSNLQQQIGRLSARELERQREGGRESVVWCGLDRSIETPTTPERASCRSSFVNCGWSDLSIAYVRYVYTYNRRVQAL